MDYDYDEFMRYIYDQYMLIQHQPRVVIVNRKDYTATMLHCGAQLDSDITQTRIMGLPVKRSDDVPIGFPEVY